MPIVAQVSGLYSSHCRHLFTTIHRLLDIRNFGGGRTTIGIPPFTGLTYVDAENVTGDSVSRIYANSVDATSGIVDSLGLVTALVMTPVPEPSTLALLTVSLGVMALVWKRMKKGKHVTPIADKSFSYAMKPGPDPDPTKSPTGEAEYAAHWDIRRFDLETNLYDLYVTDDSSVSSRLTGIPRGVSMFGLNEADIPPYIFPVFIFRENVVRHIDHLQGEATQDTFGINATTIGNGLIEQNVVDAEDPHPLSYKDSGSLAHLQNHSTSGGLIHGYDVLANKTLDDLESRILDALTMSL